MLEVLESGTIIVPVGSRVTCSPPPTDTDEDFLLLVDNLFESVGKLKEIGFTTGMTPEQEKEYEALARVSMSSFKSLRFGDVNYIVTQSYFFFERFLTATHICKKLNLLDKSDRIMVFNAVFGESYHQEIDGMNRDLKKKVKNGIRDEITSMKKVLTAKEAFSRHVLDLADAAQEAPFELPF